MADKLERYNEALGHLSERKLANLSEAREPRRVLDDYWDSTIKLALSSGFWNFAMRAVEVTASPSVSPAFGYQYAFQKPDDWVRTFQVSESETFDPPLLTYNDESGYLYANSTPLYWKYVSSDAAYGLNLGGWPENFADYVSTMLARKACLRITKSDTRLKTMFQLEKVAKGVAKASDAMDDPVGFPPTGTWVRSRRGGPGNGSDPSGSRLIG